LKHDYQAYKLFALSELLKSAHPTTILELGSGTSTVILADYVRKYNGFLTSVDENPQWLENSRRLADVNELDERFELVSAERRIEYAETSPPEIRYQWNPVRSYDFVVVDGPSMRIDGKRRKDAINTDIFDVVEVNKPATIVVDIRAATVYEIGRRLAECYDPQLSDLITQNISPHYRYFSVFVRKSRQPDDRRVE